MENENKAENPVNNTESNEDRLKTIAENSGQTVEELLKGLEEKQAVVNQNTSAKDRSTGAQNSESNYSFDPAGTEFLKGIWGK